MEARDLKMSQQSLQGQITRSAHTKYILTEMMHCFFEKKRKKNILEFFYTQPQTSIETSFKRKKIKYIQMQH